MSRRDPCPTPSDPAEGRGSSRQADRPSGLRTDFYELSMLRGYLLSGLADRRVVFDLFLRRIPEQGGYCVAAGLAEAVRFIREAHFSEEDLAFLRGNGLDDEAFLDRLRSHRFTGDLYAMPEGTLVFPLEPLLRIEAPLWEAQHLESALLNAVNFQTLIATKAARLCGEAGYDQVIEFGLRRAQGPDGALSASRAAYIGGAAATSNTEAGRRWGISVRGTMAHSWVMAFGDELEAFRAYAAAYPGSTILLVDTYDTLRSGLPNAIRVGLEMKARGETLRGIRLDSGDLAYLSIRARELLDRAGLHETRILASGDLDEWIVHDLHSQGARIDFWGVGTRLVTGHGEPALSGVYKLAALEEEGAWQPRLKIAERATKTTLPGRKQVWRLRGREGWWEGDLIAQVDEAIAPAAGGEITGYHPLFEYESKRYENIVSAEPLLEPVLLGGEPVGELPSPAAARERARSQLERLHPTSRRLLNPHTYKVSVSEQTLELRRRLREALERGASHP